MAVNESVFEVRDANLSDDKDDVDSLPSISTSELYSDEDTDAQEEWERSLEQVQILLTMVLVPWMGKYFGRKFAYWSWARYMEWAHNVEVRWTNKTANKVIGAVEVTRAL